jgi:general secretion pathway protein H
MRTSATSRNAPVGSLPLRFGSHRNSSGFTLIELLVVLAIAGLSIAVVPAALSKAKEVVEYRNTVREVLSGLRTGRSNAQTYARPTRFYVNLAERSYGLDPNRLHRLPDALEMRVTVADEQLQFGQIGSIEFLPVGGATGGSIDIIRKSGQGTRVRVNWISGQIELEPVSK